MRRLAASLLAVALIVLLPTCSEQSAMRTDQPAQLVEDLARSLIAPSRRWQEEEKARDESTTLGHPSSAEVSVLAIGFQRLVGQARSALEPHLPPETRGVPVPQDLSRVARLLATRLAAAAAEDISAAEESRTPNSARVRLTIAAPGLEAQSWILTLERHEQIWRFTAAPRRG